MPVSAGTVLPRLPVKPGVSQPAGQPACLPASSKPFLTERDRNLAARLPPTLKVTYRVNVKVINHSNELET